jgi:hypothetical protein
MSGQTSRKAAPTQSKDFEARADRVAQTIRSSPFYRRRLETAALEQQKPPIGVGGFRDYLYTKPTKKNDWRREITIRSMATQIISD